MIAIGVIRLSLQVDVSFCYIGHVLACWIKSSLEDATCEREKVLITAILDRRTHPFCELHHAKVGRLLGLIDQPGPVESAVMKRQDGANVVVIFVY